MNKMINVVCTIGSLFLLFLGMIRIETFWEINSTSGSIATLANIIAGSVYLLIGASGILLQIYLFNKHHKGE